MSSSGPKDLLFPFYTVKLSKLLADLRTDKETGLRLAEVKQRRVHYGKNRLPEPEKVSPLKLLLKQFASFMIYILLGAVALSLFLRDYKDAFLIGIVVIVNAVIDNN